jgi:hypothetical protein
MAKTALQVHAAILRAGFEKQLAARYSFDQSQVWQKAHEQVQIAVEKANQAVAKECRRLGIPAEFGPHIDADWYHRGENASERRDELRKVAYTRIEALVRDAKFKIEQFSLETQTTLLADGLESSNARAFLESMPTAEQLVPELKIADIEAVTPKPRWLVESDGYLR